MIERLACIVFGTLICIGASAQSLEDRVRELERRIEQLEKQVAQPTPPVGASKPATGRPDGWRQRENWRSLKRGMTERDVSSVLGEPQKVSSYPSWRVWNYPGGGSARFGSDDRLDGWDEPR